MRNVPMRWGLICAASVALLLGGSARAQQDSWSEVERIVAVGDVHGDHEQFLKALRAGEVIDKNDDWAAGKTHLVQLGDVLDRGPDSRKAMDLLMKLEKQAAEAGGAVHALIGNHEAMVLLGDLRYMHPGEEKAFGGAEEYRKAMGPEGKYGKWILSHNTVVKINDLLFVHAGITPAFARLSLAQINKAVCEELKKGDAEGTVSGLDGPLWDRSLSLGKEDHVAQQLGDVLKAYGARHMVAGHTVTGDGIALRAGGRLIRIDVGMTAYYGGPAACLVVEKGVFYEASKTRRKLPIVSAASAPASAPARAPASRPAGATVGASGSAASVLGFWLALCPTCCFITPLPRRLVITHISDG